MLARTLAILLLACALPAQANLNAVSNQDAAAGLKSALEKGAVVAVDLLGKTDGFFGNGAVKIPLPDSLKKYEKLMRNVGMGKHADELILTMNRAAEAAVPEAKKLFVDSVRKMSVQDAKGVLTGGQTSGTDYFKRTTTDQLRRAVQPVRAEGRAVRPGEEGAGQPGRLRHAESARRPLLHGRRGREEDPPGPGPGGQRHRAEGFWRA